jgi:uncharacterized membrane protein YccF (DUF307 family)
MADKKFKQRIVTPKGIAAFAYLREPDTKFNSDGIFRISVFFDKNDAEFKALVKKVKAAAKKLNIDGTPIKLCNEKMAETTGQKVGTPFIEFRTKVSERTANGVPVYNARAQKDLSLNVYGGDIVKVDALLAEWETAGKRGLKFYLNYVQLLKSNWTGSGHGFGEEEDYLDDDDNESLEADDSEFDDLEDESFEEEDIDADDDDGVDPTADLL